MANEVSVDLVLKPTSDKAAFNKIESEAKKSGESAGDSFGEGFKGGVATVAKVAAAAAAAAAAAIGLAFKKGIDEAIKQEDAVNRLNFALQSTGQFSVKASEDLQKFADQLEATSKFGGDAALTAAGLIQQLVALDTQGLKRATQASADLAAFLGTDLENAASLVAKAIDGNVASLSRYGVKVKEGASEAETLNNVLGALESKFGGLAQSQVNTYSGAVTQLGGAFNKLFEELGNIIIRNPVIISLIKDTKDAFLAGAAAIAEFGQSFNIIESVINPLVSLGNFIVTFLVAPLELLGNSFVAVFRVAEVSLASLVARAGIAGAKIAEFLNILGLDNGITDSLKAFGETSTQVFEDSSNKAIQSFQSILDFPLSNGLLIQNEELRSTLEARNQIIQSSNDIAITKSQEGIIGIGEVFNRVGEGLNIFAAQSVTTTAKLVEQTNQKIKEFAAQTSVAIRNGVGVAAGNAFAAFGKALVEGENAASAFTKAFVQSIGQVAVQQGTSFILQGIGYQFVPGFQGVGAGMITAGAALAVFGGALSAVGGSGRPAVGGGGIGGSADVQTFPSPQETLNQPEEVAQRSESGPRVQLIVQGDIFNTEETGNRLIDILNSNFENKGNSFNNARFA